MIVFLVASFRGNNSGVGGHYVSTATVAREMAKHEDVLVVNIGDFESPTLRSIFDNVVFVEIPRLRWNRGVAQIQEVLADANPRLIHCFDGHALLYGRLIARQLDIPIVHTKCGGPVQARHPNVRPDTCFSAADFDHYSRVAAKHGMSPPALISGRVSADHSFNFSSTEDLSALPPKTTGELRVVRVGRVHAAYRESHLQAIALTKQLNATGTPTKLFIIGHNNDDELATELAAMQSEHFELHTTRAYTVNGARHLLDADVVVATGRGVMEAIALGKPTFCSQANSGVPALLTDQNFDHFIRENFSSRAAKIQGHKVDDDLDFVRNYHDSLGVRQAYRSSLKTLFDRHCSVETAALLYRDVYDEADTPDTSWRGQIDFAEHLGSVTARKFLRSLSSRGEPLGKANFRK